MTVKSIIDVEVNAQAFERYQQLFARYQREADKGPGLWKSINKGIIETSLTQGRMTAAIKAQVETQKQMADIYKAQNRSLTQGERLWGSMAKHAGGIASNIIKATRSLISWTSIIGGIGGLLGAGGLFGIDKMARQAGNERRSATGLGLSIGEEKAFGINFGRAVDSGSFLSWINQMEHDPSAAKGAYGLGVGLTGQTGNDAVSMLTAIRARARGMDPKLRGMMPKMFGLDGVNGEDINRLASMSDTEFGQLKSGFNKDRSSLNINDPTAKAWADFIKRLDEAKEGIFKTFVTGLLPLAGPLGHLSESVEKFITVLLKSDIVKTAITDLSGWLEKFSGELGGEAFLTRVKAFTSDLGDLGDMIHNVAHPSTLWDKFTGAMGAQLQKGTDPDSYYKYATDAERSKYLAAVDDKYDLPTGTTEAVWARESSKQFDGVKDSTAGAQGPFQWKPESAAAYRINANSWSDSAYGAGHYLSDLRKRFHGDMGQALAAYNWGPGNVDASNKGTIKGHPTGWLPDDVRNYVKATDVSVHVTVTMPPGSNLNAVATAMAH